MLRERGKPNSCWGHLKSVCHKWVSPKIELQATNQLYPTQLPISLTVCPTVSLTLPRSLALHIPWNWRWLLLVKLWSRVWLASEVTERGVCAWAVFGLVGAKRSHRAAGRGSVVALSLSAFMILKYFINWINYAFCCQLFAQRRQMDPFSYGIRHAGHTIHSAVR